MKRLRRPSRSSWRCWARRCRSNPSPNMPPSWTPRVSDAMGVSLVLLGVSFVLLGCPLWFLPLQTTRFLADSTGTHSLYTTYQDYEIMFHVSTMLPYTPNNRQQVEPPKLALFLPALGSVS